MGQLQRDDRRRVQQGTVELWEIEQGRAGAVRPRQRRLAGRSPQRRQSPQGRQSQQERQSPQRRQVKQAVRQTVPPGERRSRQEREIRQTGQSPSRRQSRQARAVPYRREEELQFMVPVDYPDPGNPRPVKSIRRRRARRRKIFLSRAVAVLFILVCLALIYQAIGAAYRYIHRDMYDMGEKEEGFLDAISDKVSGKKIAPPEIIEDYLEINDYSRPGTKLKKVNSVFVHYTANKGTSAENNRSYFANLAQTHERAASAHFIIGYDGEVIQCIPLNEQAYAVIGRNEDSVSVECCYLAEDGSFTPQTYETLLHTLAWLLEEYDLTTKDILRHYDCGGKKCPLYYVEHEDAWKKLLSDVEAYEAPTE